MIMMVEELLSTQNILGLFAFLTTGLLTILGMWALRMQSQIDEQGKSLAEYKIYIEANLAKKSDLQDGFAKIDVWLHRIYDKLDSKQDK